MWNDDLCGKDGHRPQPAPLRTDRLWVPAQSSSLGKCMLAFCSGDKVEYLMFKSGIECYTPNSITSLRQFKEHLRVVRRQGWVMDNEEYVIGHRCIGAPVYDYHGEVIAVVSASGPQNLLSDEPVEEVVTAVKSTA